ncbi:MAG: site-specific DNA-methyltransferase [Candidatus Symbiothrix sp.]|nr:site-specific DNA-methyltransferase [Candidatus Symbiothrix sp.]
MKALNGIEDNSIDLIYLDPPFFSNQSYEVIWGDKEEVRSFEDRFEGNIENYISWLYERVELMYKKLKPTGSMFLHCDWHANANIRVEILDKLFGRNNFRNEIIWHYKGREKYNEKKVQSRYDSIFFYGKTEKMRINYVKFDWDKEDRVKMLRRKIHKDTDGREWFWETRGQANGIEPYKKYLDEYLEKGEALNDVWVDIPMLRGNHPERIGYPTQKPELLLERIIKLATNEGDTVLDPFVGGGTTIAVADRLGRNWIGIDLSAMAIKVSDLRLKKQHNVFSQPYDLILRKYDYEILRNSEAFEFESWIIKQFGGISNERQRSDQGIDGKTTDGIPIQVKRSDNIDVNKIKNFWASIQQFDKNLYEKNVAEGKITGYFIAFSFGRGAVEFIATLKNKYNTIIKLVKVSDIVDYIRKPEVSLSANPITNDEYEFIAKAQSEYGIDFYSWDFSHDEEVGFKPDIWIDKTGKKTKKFSEGEYQIAVQANDNEGFDNTDKVKIKVKK